MLYILTVVMFLMRTIFGQEEAEGGCKNDQRPITINTYGGAESSANTQLTAQIEELQKRIATLESRLMMSRDFTSNYTLENIRDCQDVYHKMNARQSGVYTISPKNGGSFDVYCNFDKEGLWTILQRRVDETVIFDRVWSEYVKGFGRLGLHSNHWLGLDNMHAITKQRQYTARFDMTDWDDVTRYAEYNFFEIGDASSRYFLNYGEYKGTAGDSMETYHMQLKFSTKDSDNDDSQRNCALDHMGGWWYRDCDRANLNGKYLTNPNIETSDDNGIEWDAWKQRYSFKQTQIRIKPTFQDD